VGNAPDSTSHWLPNGLEVYPQQNTSTKIWAT